MIIKNWKQFNEQMKSEFPKTIGDSFKQIITSPYDEEIKKLFNDLKNEFNINNLIYPNNGIDDLKYEMNNGDIILIRDDMFFAIPGYNININGEDIEASYYLIRKIYRFLKNKFKNK